MHNLQGGKEMALKENAVRRANREAQRAYRAGHADDLLKARRVSTSLMRLRAVHASLTPKQELSRMEAQIRSTVTLLSDFLTGQEMECLLRVLRSNKRLYGFKKGGGK